MCGSKNPIIYHSFDLSTSEMPFAVAKFVCLSIKGARKGTSDNSSVLNCRLFLYPRRVYR